MSGNFIIRAARPSETGVLSELALNSKAHWGYGTDFLEACREELSVDAAYLNHNPVFVIEKQNVPAGFYSLEHISETEVELGLLFVTPPYIGCGLGRRLMQHSIEQAADAGYESMLIQGDPNAERFYLAAGGRPAGTRLSGSIPGRYLPLFRIRLPC